MVALCKKIRLSLSARRAWIEIGVIGWPAGRPYVALRKESVDRNAQQALKMMKNTESLSARRAWIEIGAPTKQAGKHAVALRKESVDRNVNK